MAKIQKVRSLDLQRKFGEYRTKALREPVIITHHGRDDLALMAADEYTRLKALDRQTLYAWELPQDVVDELGTVPIPEEAHQFDHEYEP